MKSILIYVSRLLVGSLLIVSGIIKANDALGFSYKLNEYFTEGILGMEFLRPYTLAMAAFICIFEVVLGIALIYGLKAKLVSTLNLLMMLFFTFLTFYSAYFDKVKDCGCFGDALKLTPWESFTKDAVLLVFSLILFLFRKEIHPNKKREDLRYILPALVLIILFAVGVIGWWFPVIFSIIVFILMFVVKRFDSNSWRQLALPIIATTVFTVYCYNHLPIKDFRPYKISANIKKGMEVPEDALPELVDYYWKFNVNGEEKIFKTNGSYPKVDGGTYVGVETKTVREAPEPPIHDFTIEGENDDTELYLSKNNVLAIVAYDFTKSSDEGFKIVKEKTDEALKKGYTVIGLTAESMEQREALKKKFNLNFDFFFCDGTTLKTVVRANPGIVEMDKATVKQKLHWNDIDQLELETLSNANPNLNLELKRQLDSISVLDQKYRVDINVYRENVELQDDIDKSNLRFIENVFSKHGYPGINLVGEQTSEVAWYVIQHSDKIEKYMPQIKEAGENGEVSMVLVGMMEDRLLMSQGKEQIYGTQGTTIGFDKEKLINIIWPIRDAESVNERRKEAGFSKTVEENGRLIFGEGFEYKIVTLEDVKRFEEEQSAKYKEL